MNKETIGVYIHIPFCLRKCLYCDFLSFPAGGEEREEYLKALGKEIRSSGSEHPVDSVFFGGGTPSLLTGEQMGSLIQIIKDKFNITDDCEISLEANPGTLDPEKLKGYHQAGVNRLSIGLQSTRDEELKRIGRIHNWRDFLDSYEAAREEGFRNINIDLMAALPSQTLKDYRSSLERVLELKPEHISSYSLILEEGTPLYERREQLSFPDEDQERSMYALTKELLEQGGYHRYEISNYALPGYECRHNLRYWRRGEYYAFGLGASSFVEGRRRKNTSSMEEYLDTVARSGKAALEEDILLTREDAMAEFMFLGLRCMQGVTSEEFKDRFGVSLKSVYGKVLDRYLASGHLKQEGFRYCLTDSGIDVSNHIFSDFLI